MGWGVAGGAGTPYAPTVLPTVGGGALPGAVTLAGAGWVRARPPLADRQAMQEAAAERGGNNLYDFQVIHTENGSSQGQNLALTGVCVSSSLDSSAAGQHLVRRAE